MTEDISNRVEVAQVRPNRDGIPSLTGLRFWAAMLVVLYHANLLVGSIPGISFFVEYGRTGVTFFFVLSGFILAWNYWDRPTRPPVFYWRRFARIYPLFVVTAALSLGVYVWMSALPGLAETVGTFLLLQAWVPNWREGGANPPAWTLSCEAFFYAVFPLMLLVAARWRRHLMLLLWLALAVMVVTWAVAGGMGNSWVLDVFPATRALQFAVGVLAGILLREGRRWSINYGLAIAAVIGYHVGLVAWSEWHDGGVRYTLDPYSAYMASSWLATPVFLLLIVAAAQRDLDGRPTGLKSPTMLKLGHWSFALYLVNEMIFRAWDHFQAPVDNVTLRILAWIALAGLSQIAAALLYKAVEHPAEKYLRVRWFGRTTPAAGQRDQVKE
ncbi:acyltransferase [Nocardioides conyzicola]|uniref:Acyltransferase n=1 Tax=Nocardioides conyzicola TaxID=1651781 RepID=A0ABP8XI55_9ACTN